MPRKVADCRQYPDPSTHCTLTISGEEEEVVRAACDHAVAVHGHERTPDLENEIRKMLTDELPMDVSQRAAPEQPAPAPH